MNQITVIYHSADFDGIFCREIARKFLPTATLIGWDYGNPKLRLPEGRVYILDLSPECLDFSTFGSTGDPDIIWIDHHKSAIEKWPKAYRGYRIDGVAACRLAWQWFSKHELFHQPTAGSFAVPLPLKQEFIDRVVPEPYAVRLAGEYDIWDRRDPNAEVFQFGLRSEELTDFEWAQLLDPTVSNVLSGTGMEQTNSELIVTHLLKNGRLLQRYQQQSDASTVASRSFTQKWEGLTFLCLNTARCNSLTFTSAVKPEHDALMGFYWNGKKWTFSLYHAPHRTDIDLSQIAVKYGGGGHRGACGFQTSELPWPKNTTT
jgi:uncharacterized protein